jgi:hypothetical protein
MKNLRTKLKRARALRSFAFAAQNLVVLFKRRQVHLAAAKRPQRFLSAMVRVKDEARFLPEWLACQRELGVEHVYVYDNGSGDNFEEILQPFLRDGYITLIPWPQRPVSPSADLHFLNTFGHLSTWVSFMDVDEFVRESSSGELLRVLRSMDFAPALAINWRYFGSSGFRYIPDGLVIENFDQADEKLNDHVKVIAQPSMIHRYRNSHNFYYKRGRLARVSDGRRVLGSFAAPSSGKKPSLEIAHYVYRSRADYENKLRRGFSDRRGEIDADRTIARIESEYQRHNEVRVEVDMEMIKRVRTSMQRLGVAREFWLSEPDGVR